MLHEETRPELCEALGLARRTRPAPGEAGTPGVAAPAPGPPGGARAPAEATPYQVRLAGAGGQGIVLAGLLLAEAAIADGRNATQAQAYGLV